MRHEMLTIVVRTNAFKEKTLSGIALSKFVREKICHPRRQLWAALVQISFYLIEYILIRIDICSSQPSSAHYTVGKQWKFAFWRSQHWKIIALPIFIQKYSIFCTKLNLAARNEKTSRPIENEETKKEKRRKRKERVFKSHNRSKIFCLDKCYDNCFLLKIPPKEKKMLWSLKYEIFLFKLVFTRNNSLLPSSLFVCRPVIVT